MSEKTRSGIARAGRRLGGFRESIPSWLVAAQQVVAQVLVGTSSVRARKSADWRAGFSYCALAVAVN